MIKVFRNMAQYYSITISPPPMCKLKPQFEHGTYETTIRQILNKFSKQYIVYPEFDKKDRLHYHGVFRMDDKIAYLKNKYLLFKQIGFTKCDKIEDFENKLRWLIYISKDWGQNKEIFEGPIMYENMRRYNRRIRAVSRGARPITIFDYFKITPYI